MVETEKRKGEIEMGETGTGRAIKSGRGDEKEQRGVGEGERERDGDGKGERIIKVV